MVRPVLLAVDDEPAALDALEGELGKRYGADYEVVCADTPEAGLRRLEQLQADGGQLALVLADQWMPSMTGVEFLGRVRRLHPRAQRVVLINWGDRSTAEPILQASALGQIDDWMAKPWGPGDEFFHQAISGFLNEWARLHRPRFEVFRVVGEQWAPRSHEIRDLLSRNSIRSGFYPVDSEQGRALLGQASVTAERLPVVVLFDGRVLVDLSNAELADALGIKTRTEAITGVVGNQPRLGPAPCTSSPGHPSAVTVQEARVRRLHPLWVIQGPSGPVTEERSKVDSLPRTVLQIADSASETANPNTTRDPVHTPSTAYASGSRVSASIASSAPAANPCTSAPVRALAGSSTA
jgi:CheY-like chemotaxis protein